MRWWLGLVALTATMAAIAACDASVPESPTPTGSLTFHEGGLAFTYPAAWHVFHHDEASSFTTLIADLATVDVPPPCITTQLADGRETACGDRFRLVPNSLVVH